MRMNYKIRYAIPNDVCEIVRLCSEHAEFEQAEFSSANKAEKLAKALFSANPHLFCLVVESSDGEILGYATFTKEFSTWDANFYIHLDCLFLSPPTRNLGIGEKIINKVRDFALKYGCFQIQWQTPVFNERAIKFYKRIGAKDKAKVRFYLNL
jgi:ribosomal protein S18 acetylase RimI-like enzyme